jgi:hypothetical protein
MTQNIERPLGVSGESPPDARRAPKKEGPGEPTLCVAVLDGRGADKPLLSRCLAHPRRHASFRTRRQPIQMSSDGTYVTSVIVRRPVTGIVVLAARGRGLVMRVFRANGKGGTQW